MQPAAQPATGYLCPLHRVLVAAATAARTRAVLKVFADRLLMLRHLRCLPAQRPRHRAVNTAAVAGERATRGTSPLPLPLGSNGSRCEGGGDVKE
eukprot:3594860-Prymnesium_polylepis.1